MVPVVAVVTALTMSVPVPVASVPPLRLRESAPSCVSVTVASRITFPVSNTDPPLVRSPWSVAPLPLVVMLIPSAPVVTARNEALAAPLAVNSRAPCRHPPRRRC